MKAELDNYLTQALKRLEKAYQEILKTQGYTQEVEKIKILAELIKEQNPDENTHLATR